MKVWISIFLSGSIFLKKYQIENRFHIDTKSECAII